MGPHSFERGIGAIARHLLQRRRLASMGPHSFDSGICPKTRYRPDRVTRFNGAALIRVRNIAPAFRLARRVPLLQWGRTHSSAEYWPSRKGVSESASLQWGRTHSSAE